MKEFIAYDKWWVNKVGRVFGVYQGKNETPTKGEIILIDYKPYRVKDVVNNILHCFSVKEKQCIF